MKLAKLAPVMLAAALLAGCGGENPGTQSRPIVADELAQAELAAGTEVWVEGFVLRTDTATYLCGGLMESLPPQCNSEVTLTNLPDDWADQSEQGVTWTNSLRTVHGTLTDPTTIEVIQITRSS